MNKMKKDYILEQKESYKIILFLSSFLIINSVAVIVTNSPLGLILNVPMIVYMIAYFVRIRKNLIPSIKRNNEIEFLLSEPLISLFVTLFYLATFYLFLNPDGFEMIGSIVLFAVFLVFLIFSYYKELKGLSVKLYNYTPLYRYNKDIVSQVEKINEESSRLNNDVYEAELIDCSIINEVVKLSNDLTEEQLPDFERVAVSYIPAYLDTLEVISKHSDEALKEKSEVIDLLNKIQSGIQEDIDFHVNLNNEINSTIQEEKKIEKSISQNSLQDELYIIKRGLD